MEVEGREDEGYLKEGKSRKKAKRDEDAGGGEVDARKVLGLVNAVEEDERGEFRAPTTRVGKRGGLGAAVEMSDDSEEWSEDGADDRYVEADGLMEDDLITEDDAQLLESVWGVGGERRTVDLGALIMEKLREREVDLERDGQLETQLEPRVRRVYAQVGRILSKYRSGQVPRPLKVVPALARWEEILAVMCPEAWTPAAVRVATRLFASNLKPRAAQRYYEAVLLPKVRADIAENKRLNVHLYRALEKATFKPEAFYRGIIFPLASARDCTLREATIVASVIARKTLPPAHSAVALLKISLMPYNGASSIFMRTLLEKRYALPYKAVDAVAEHFATFRSDDRQLPVLWHRTLLSFVQHYKRDLTRAQRRGIFDLVKDHFHYLISPEVRRELEHSTPRDQA